MGLRYSREELNGITGMLSAGQSTLSAGAAFTKTSDTHLDGNTAGHAVMDMADSNLQAYAAALSKNISDMFNLGNSFDAFDEAQRVKNMGSD